MQPNAEAPNVMSPKELAELVQNDSRIQIVCLKAAFKDKSFIKGVWVVRAFDEAEGTEKYLSSVARDMSVSIRHIKSLNGVVSTMLDAGFTELVLPTKEGQASTNTLKPKP